MGNPMIQNIPSQLYKIFKDGSKTYFYSSLFFPSDVRSDVFVLYSFVRTADDFVDQVPQQAKQFESFRSAYERACAGTPSGELVIDSFVELQQRRGFDTTWVDSFFDAMARDLKQVNYAQMEDTISYMYGSAEVIGLMMCRILELDEDAHSAACLLGRSMQYVNFIRDIQEDVGLGRVYFPQIELMKFGISSLRKDAVERDIPAFTRFLQEQIKHYERWSAQGELGYAYIPRRYVIPIKTANDLYHWTALEIAKQPMTVYERKVKPSVPRILLTLVKNTVWSLWR